MLQLHDVGVRFGDTVAVDDVTLEVPEGEVLAVLGPSGCGKSTLLRAIAGLEELATGTVALDGADLSGVPTHKRGFALMFQDGQLFRHLDVAGNIAYPLRLRRAPGPDRARRSAPQTPTERAELWSPATTERAELRSSGTTERAELRSSGTTERAELRSSGTTRAATAQRVEELLETVGLPGYGSREVSTLSGGEQQRVALARALAAEPRLLLLDEPLSALDRSLRERLAADLRGILTGTGTTALLVTHDHDEAFTLADRMALMFDGRIVQHGPTQQVWNHPASREAAEFIGFSTFLQGEAAARVLAAGDGAPGVREHGQTLALRRSALRVDPDGPLSGTVVSTAATSDAVRVELDLDQVGRVEGLAGQDSGLRVGDRVRVRVDRTGTALVPHTPVGAED